MSAEIRAYCQQCGARLDADDYLVDMYNTQYIHVSAEPCANCMDALLARAEATERELAELMGEMENLEGEINGRDAVLKQIGYTFRWEGEEPAYCCDYCDFPLGEGHADGCQNPYIMTEPPEELQP